MDAVLDDGTLILVRNGMPKHNQVEVAAMLRAKPSRLRESLRRYDAVSHLLQQQLARPQESHVIRNGEDLRHRNCDAAWRRLVPPGAWLETKGASRPKWLSGTPSLLRPGQEGRRQHNRLKGDRPARKQRSQAALPEPDFSFVCPSGMRHRVIMQPEEDRSGHI